MQPDQATAIQIAATLISYLPDDELVSLASELLRAHQGISTRQQLREQAEKIFERSLTRQVIEST